MYPWFMLDFDHIKGEKLFNLSEAVVDKTSMDKLICEMLKCEVVCANCHRIRTFSRLGYIGA